MELQQLWQRHIEVIIYLRRVLAGQNFSRYRSLRCRPVLLIIDHNKAQCQTVQVIHAPMMIKGTKDGNTIIYKLFILIKLKPKN